MVLTLLLTQTFKVAFIDMERIYNEYIDLRDAKEQVMRFKATLEIKRDSFQMKLDSARENLFKQWPMLTDGEKVLRWREIEILENRLDSINREIIRQVEAKSKEVMTPYVKKVRETAEKIAKDMGYDAVLDISTAVWVDPRHDITPLVLDELNKAHKTAGLVIKKLIVFPFKEEDVKVSSLNLGDSVQIYIYGELSRNPRLDIMDVQRVNSALQTRGYTWKTLNERVVYTTSQGFAPDVYFFGSVKSSSDNTVDVVIALYDGKTGQIIRVGENQLRKEIKNVRTGADFKNAVSQTARQLMNLYLDQFK